MDLQAHSAKPESTSTNFDDFIPEVYHIKNRCKGHLVGIKMENEEYSSEYSESEIETNYTEIPKGRTENARYRKDKPFRCSSCDFVTAWKCNIIRHKQQHTREKIYSCHLCSYTALQKSNLRTHIRIHLGDKRFACNLCDYKTMYKSTLDVHKKRHSRNRTHNGKKPVKEEMSDEEVLNYKVEYKNGFEENTALQNVEVDSCDNSISDVEFKMEDYVTIASQKSVVVAKPLLNGTHNDELDIEDSRPDWFQDKEKDVNIVELKPSELDL